MIIEKEEATVIIQKAEDKYEKWWTKRKGGALRNGETVKARN